MPPKDPTGHVLPKPKTIPTELLRPSPRNRRTTVDEAPEALAAANPKAKVAKKAGKR